MDDEVRQAATRVLDACRARKLTVATAESCTGGLVAGALTEIAGSSDVVDRGFVTYSNAAKQAMLGVPAPILERHGAVSRATAEAMARGAITQSGADLAVAITGIAGPDGGTTDKPVGLVYLAAGRASEGMRHERCSFGNVGRAGIRRLSVERALSLLFSLL